MINSVFLMGYLGADPVVRKTSSGDRKVANLSIATNETWRDSNGDRQERVEWHRVVLFGRIAEIAEQYLKKGSLVHIQGRLQTRQWEDRDGNTRYTTEVVALPTGLRMVGGRSNGQQRRREEPPPPKQEDLPDETPFNDDIPF